MPKQQLALVQFHGGFQDALDQRDIPEEALAECTNASITKLGSIRTMSHASYIAPRPSSLPDVFAPGYGYYIYGADYDVPVSVSAQSIEDYTSSPYNAFPSQGGDGDFVQVNVSGGHGLSVGDKVTISSTTGNYTGTAESGTANNQYNTHTGHTHFTVVKIVSTTAFVMDATYDQSSATTTAITVTRNNSGEFIHRLIQNSEKFHVIVEDKANGAFSTNLDQIVLGSNTTNVLPVFHRARNGVRVCDANFDNSSNEAKWFGYIPTKYYGYGSAASPSEIAYTLTAGWYSEDMFLIGGGSGQTGTLTGGDAAGASSGVIYKFSDDDGSLAYDFLGEESDGVVWSIYGNTAEGEFQAATTGDEHMRLLFGHSWVYDGYQETPAKIIETEGDADWVNFAATGSDQSLEVQAYIKMLDSGLNIPSKRITGMKLYIMGTSPDTSIIGTIYDDPLLLAEVDLTKGIRAHDGQFVDFDSTTKYGAGWHDCTHDGDSGGTNWAITTQKIISNHPSISFRMLNGYSHNVPSINAKYKASCVVDGRAYIGNIQQDIHGDGVMETFEDRVLVCAVGVNGPMPDVFPSDKVLEITSNDGDSIVSLVAHKEKIVQLNKGKAIIINVYGPNDLETVESTWEGAGITQSSAAVSFNGGVAWANKNGCYIYNGEAVLNLIDNKVRLETWRDFILSGVDEHCSIGYCDKDKTITVSNQSDKTYTFNIITQSWMKGYNLIQEGTKSNFITSTSGEIEYVVTSEFGMAESITVHPLTSHLLGEFSTASIIFNKWDGTGDTFTDYLEFSETTWRTMSENQIVMSGTSTTDSRKLKGIARSIKNAVNALADGTYAFNAETAFHEFMGGWPNINIVTLTSRTRGVATNADDINDFGDATFDGMRFAASDNANGLQVINNAGSQITFTCLIAPSGGVDPVAQVDILEINRDGIVTADDFYNVSFNIENPVTGDIAVSVNVEYTTSSSDEEEEVIAGLIDLINAEAGDKVTCAPAEDIAGTLSTDTSHNYLKITTNLVSGGSGEYWKLSGLTASINDHEGDIYSFVPTIPNNPTSNFSIKTRDIDLGAPGVRKKIYKVYVTYKCTGDSNISVTYGTDQGDCVNTFDSTASTNYALSNAVGTLDTSSGATAIAELKPSSSINNIYSFQIALDSIGVVPSDFEINDITVVYRPKRVK